MAAGLGQEWSNRVKTPSPPNGQSTIAVTAVCVAAALALMITFSLVDIRRIDTYRSDFAIWQDALRHQPEDPFIHNNLGKALANSDRLDDAVVEFREAVRLKPRFVEAIYNLGTALNRLGQPQQALEQFDRGLLVYPNDAIAQNNAGNALLKLGKPAAAVERYRKAIQIDPKYSKAHFNLAIADARLNQRAQAIAAAETALTLARAKGSMHLAQEIEAWLANYRSSQAPADTKN